MLHAFGHHVARCCDMLGVENRTFAHALAQHCCTNPAKRLQHHATSTNVAWKIWPVSNLSQQHPTCRNTSQHVSSWWPNARNMLHTKMLRYVAFKYCDRLAGALLLLPTNSYSSTPKSRHHPRDTPLWYFIVLLHILSTCALIPSGGVGISWFSPPFFLLILILILVVVLVVVLAFLLLLLFLFIINYGISGDWVPTNNPEITYFCGTRATG